MSDVYVFTSDVEYSIIDDYRGQGMPGGLRYAASVTGPWRVFGIYEVPERDGGKGGDLSVLPMLTQPPEALGSETGVTRGRYLKRSRYHDVASFVRVHIGAADPEEVLEDVRAIVRGDGPEEDGEAESVMGAFDILAYCGGDTEAQMVEKIRQIRGLPTVLRTMTLAIIDYVSISPGAPQGHHAKPRTAD